jgi:hypothetical protein
MCEKKVTDTTRGTIAAMCGVNGWMAVLLCLLAVSGMARAAETLYNGIVLPDEWPPKRSGLPREPMPVPYLKDQPAVIPIDVGRQLFVDDFLIQETTLKRTFHSAEYHAENPVLKPDKPWEIKGKSNVAFPYSGGVWHDPAENLFKMWYAVGNEGWITHWFGYAVSKDGIHWEKPALQDIAGRRKELDGSNVILDVSHHDSSVIWLDHTAADPSTRFKYFATEKQGGWRYIYRTSRDGIHWSGPVASKPIWGDRATIFSNPFRKVWCLSQRIHGGNVGRARAYMEDRDPGKLVEKIQPNQGLAAAGESVFWTNADDLDPRNPVEEYGTIRPQLYNLDATPYESLMLGFFAIWTGPENDTVARERLQKRCDILLGFSRDGFHWDRPHRERFIAANWADGAWNFGNIQSAGGGCLVVGDKLYFYVSARARDATGGHGNGSAGLAILRRDGFASMHAGDTGGTLTTRPLTFKGKHLFVNADCPHGELKAEVLDKDGKAIEPFTVTNCEPVSCDKTLAALTWKGSADLSAVAGKPVRFRFHLNNGGIYAFWVSPDKSGASHGYVAAGGPGFTGPTDTVGKREQR